MKNIRNSEFYADFLEAVGLMRKADLTQEIKQGKILVYSTEGQDVSAADGKKAALDLLSDCIENNIQIKKSHVFDNESFSGSHVQVYELSTGHKVLIMDKIWTY